MTEYFREPNNIIKAGFALNAGKLLIQYRSLAAGMPEDKRYDVTLLISVTHAILATCDELIKSSSKAVRNVWGAEVYDVPRLFGLGLSFVKLNTIPGPLTYEGFVSHLRNALSHPSPDERHPNLPSTGYTTIKEEGTAIIRRVRFTDSPWVRLGKHKADIPAKQLEAMEGRLIRFGGGSIVARREVANGKQWRPFVDGERFLPVFVAEFSIDDLYAMTLSLANYLAQPTRLDWDGHDEIELIGRSATR